MLESPKTPSGGKLTLPECVEVIIGASCTGSIEAWKPSSDNAYNFKFSGRGDEEHLFCIRALRSFKHGGLIMTRGGGMFSDLVQPSVSDPSSVYSMTEIPLDQAAEYYFGTSANTMTVSTGDLLVVQKLKRGTGTGLVIENSGKVASVALSVMNNNPNLFSGIPWGLRDKLLNWDQDGENDDRRMRHVTGHRALDEEDGTVHTDIIIFVGPGSGGHVDVSVYLEYARLVITPVELVNVNMFTQVSDEEIAFRSRIGGNRPTVLRLRVEAAEPEFWCDVIMTRTKYSDNSDVSLAVSTNNNIALPDSASENQLLSTIMTGNTITALHDVTYNTDTYY